jgi:O-antigen ligase
MAVVVPVVLYRGSNDTFELPKQIAVRVILVTTLLAAAAASLLRLLRQPHPRLGVQEFARGLGHRLRQPASIAAVAIVASWTLATLLSAVPSASWWGIPSRWGGWRTQMGYVALFLAATAAFQGQRQVTRLAAVTAFVAAVCSVYSVVQRVGLDPLAWTVNVTEQSRMAVVGPVARPSSTFGNPNFLAAYLVLAIFLSLGGLLSTPRRQARTLWGVVVALQGVGLLLTQTRGAWIAAALGTVVLSLWLLARYGRPWRRILIGLVASGVLAAAGLAAAAPHFPQNSLLARAASILQPTKGTGGIRLYLWQIAAQVWLDRPLTGYGPDTFVSVWEQHYTLDLLHVDSGYQDHNRAENAILDTLDATGLLGGAALLLTGFVVGTAAWRLVKRASSAVARVDSRADGRVFARWGGSPDALLVALVVAVGAHLIAEQTNPEVIGASFLAWTVAGAIVGCGQTRAPLGEDDQDTGAHERHNPLAWLVSSSRRVPWGSLTVAALVVIASSGAYGAFELRALRGRRAFDLGVAASSADQNTAYLDLVTQSVSLWPYDPRFWAELAYARLAAAEARPQASRAPMYDSALAAADRAIQVNPVHPVYRSYWGEVAGRIAASTGDTALAERARAAHKLSVERAPNLWEYWQRYGLTEYRLGNYAAAKELYQHAVDIFGSYWVLWTNLGDAAIRTGDRTTARQAWQHALQICGDSRASPRLCTPAEQDSIRRALDTAGPA